MATMAAAEIGHFRLLERHLHGMGVSVDDAVRPFVARFDRVHASTAPRSWLESVVKVAKRVPLTLLRHHHVVVEQDEGRGIRRG